MKRNPILSRAIASVLTVLLAIPAWAVSPATPQLPEPGSAGMSKQDQIKLGLQAMAEVYKQMPVLPDSSPVTKYVQQLGNKLVKQIPPKNSWPYQFHVIQQKEINAFALPGGPMFINVGTIDAAQNEAQLAGVMAHEMSHVYMQHSAKHARQNTLPNILAGIGQIAGKVIGGVGGSIASAGGQIAGGVLSLKYSREDEAQADAVGAIIMFKASYNPMELANFFEILNKQGGSPPQFLSDHPNPGNRSAAIAKEIRNWAPKNYQATSQNFQEAKKLAAEVKAYTGQEISDGAKQGVWAKQNMKTGAVPASMQETVSASANTPVVSDVSFEQVRPNDSFTEVHQNGFSISYPSNWSTASGQNSITIAPKAAVSQNAIAYGVIISTVRDPNASSLDQVTQDLIQNLQQSNPGMRVNGEITSVNVNGIQGRAVDLTSNSPIQQNGKPVSEHDRLVVLPRPDGSYLYLIFIAPEKDLAALQPTYRRMLDSLRIE
jgi:Zn-dependent protease with chaperone function